jgi:hypothetical protein
LLAVALQFAAPGLQGGAAEAGQVERWALEWIQKQAGLRQATRREVEEFLGWKTGKGARETEQLRHL